MDIQYVMNIFISVVTFISYLKTVTAAECTKTGPCFLSVSGWSDRGLISVSQ